MASASHPKNSAVGGLVMVLLAGALSPVALADDAKPASTPAARPPVYAPVSPTPMNITPSPMNITPSAPVLPGPGYRSPPQRFIRAPRPIAPATNTPSAPAAPQTPTVGAPGNANMPPASGGFVTSGGSFLTGSYSDEHLRLRFNLGGVAPIFSDGYNALPWYVRTRRFGGQDFSVFRYGYGYGYGYDDSYYRQSVIIVGALSTMDPQLTTPAAQTPAPAQAQQPQFVQVPPQAEAAAPKPLTPDQRAIIAMRAQDFSTAVNAWREQVNNSPRDIVALRALGLSLIGQREQAEGVALIVMAYELDPTLAYRSASVELGRDRAGQDSLQRITANARSYAQQQGTSSAWLALAVAIQAQDKAAAAKMILKRAEDNGLEARIADELRKALR